MPRCTCRYCYDYGHNSMGCPVAKKRANNPTEGDGTLSPLEQYDKYCKDNNQDEPSIYSIRCQYGWSYELREAVEIQLKKRKRSRKTKVCNYCTQGGHNKRTCPTLKQHKSLIITAEVAYRQIALDKLKECGIGIGSTVAGVVEHYDASTRASTTFKGIGLVTDIDYGWFKLSTQHLGFTSNRRGEPLTIRWNNGASTRSEIPKQFKDTVGDVFNVSYWSSDWQLIAPSGSVCPPSEFSSGEDMDDALKEYFKNKNNNSGFFVDRRQDVPTPAGRLIAKYAGSTPTIVKSEK